MCKFKGQWGSRALLRRLAAIMVVLLLLAARPAASAWPDEAAKISSIDIQVIEDYPGPFDWSGFARVLIDFSAGDQLTSEGLARAEADISQFADVHTQIAKSPRGVDVTFVLNPYKRIKLIEISGNYPLFEQDVRNVMSVASGDLLRPDILAAQKELIAERYRREGYVDPKVSIEHRQDPQDGNYLLEIDIDKGPYYKLEQVTYIGNNAYDDDRLKRVIRSWRQVGRLLSANRFIPARLDEDIEKLMDFYRQKGFADVMISPAMKLDAQERIAVVNVTIEEGPRYHITFSGNEFFSDGTLRKELELFEYGNRGNIGLRRSIQNIRRRYQHAGFADVQVKWHEKEAAGTNGRRDIVIDIQEGGRHIVEEVRIRGNAALDTLTIRKQILTRPPSALGNGAFVPDVLQEDVTAVRALYLKHGFIDVRVDEHIEMTPEDQRVRVTIDIQEGVRTRIGEIAVEGDIPSGAGDLRQALEIETGQSFLPYQVQNEEDKLAARIAPLGYPYVQVESRVDISDESRGARITYQVDPGPHVEVGQIFFGGNFRTRRQILDRELGFETGDAFSLEEILSAQRNLRNMNIFDSVQVKPIGLKERESTVHLLFETLEKRPYYFEIGGGYQTDKGFYGRTRIGDHNFMGLNKDIWTEGEYSQIGYRWDVGISNPRLLGTKINSSASLFIEREELFNQDFGTDSVGANVTFSRPFRRYIVTSLVVRYELRDQFLRGSAAATDVDPETLEERSILVSTPSILFDSRDSFIQPRKGWYAKFDVDVSTGLENSLDNFLRYNLDLRTYYALLPRLTLAGRVYTGFLSSYGKNASIPEDQLFFLGGTTDVRGFEENLLRFDVDGSPVGGRLAIFGNVEARYDLGRNFELSTFVDAGVIRKTLEDAGDDSVRWSVGLGIHYITPIGPISLAYGFKIDPLPQESSGQIHFTIGYTF